MIPFEIYPFLFSSSSKFFFVLLRMIGLLISIPMMGQGNIPIRVRMIFSVVFSLIIFLYLPYEISYEPIEEFFALLAFSFFVGIIMGFMIQLSFAGLALAGQLVAYQMGLGFSMMSDPLNGTSSPVLSQYYSMMMLFVFLNTDGFLKLMQLFVTSFEVQPSLNGFLDMVGVLLEQSGYLMFQISLHIALPSIVVMLFLQSGLAFMTKSAPQINIFSIGFPLMIMVGMIFIVYSFELPLVHITSSLERTFLIIRSFFNG